MDELSAGATKGLDDSALMVPCRMSVSEQLKHWVLHIETQHYDVTPSAANRTWCVRADFGEAVSTVVFPLKSYAILQDFVCVLQVNYHDLDTRCPFLLVGQNDLHGCWRL